jgi:hypothetical protein
MKRGILMISLISILFSGCISSTSTVYNLYVILSPISGTSSGGSGRLDASAVNGASSISINGYFSNLTSTPTNVIVKGPNRTCDLSNGLNFSLDPGGKSGKVYGSCAGGITQAEIDQFNAGQFYGVLKTVNNPNGELRGTATR